MESLVKTLDRSMKETDRGSRSAFEPKYLKELNPEQREAVLNTEGPLLILAGAGTGKTRTITSRLAHIIDSRKAWPSQTLTVTFTNRAAKEMSERVYSYLELEDLEIHWLGTFHFISSRMLRQNAKLVGLTSSYSILDTLDQTKICKEVMEEAGFTSRLQQEQWNPRTLAVCIDRWKNRAITPDIVPIEEQGFANGKVVSLYKEYQNRLLRLNACDFGDLILHVIEILRTNPEVQEHYRKKFKYISVDEYQDTNVAQYLWLRLIAGNNRNVCCVGDDDQSIYGWRGAEVNNILEFSKNFEDTKVIKLERNYRSTQHILSVASSLIKNNASRHKKIIYSYKTTADLVDSEKVQVRSTYSGEEEVRLINDDIDLWTANPKRNYSDIAILVRATWQLREFESMFIESGTPYRVVGGLKFYERTEIKDAISYLKLVQSPNNDLAFERVINQPKRSIGNSTILKLRLIARDRNLSMLEASKCALKEGIIKGKAATGLSDFIGLVFKWQSHLTEQLKIAELLKEILIDTKYIEMLKAAEEKKYNAGTKQENLNELIGELDRYSDLQTYLERVELQTEKTDLPSNDEVQLLTFHAAKALEFPLVFLPSWEESIFPNARCLNESPNGLEEERRLAYVGITRAKESCRISFASGRFTFGTWQNNQPSRFLSELSESNLEMTYIH